MWIFVTRLNNDMIRQITLALYGLYMYYYDCGSWRGSVLYVYLYNNTLHSTKMGYVVAFLFVYYCIDRVRVVA